MWEKYDAALDAWAQEARELSKTEDERERSIQLMRASMMGDMLKQLGRAEHAGRGKLRAVYEHLVGEEAAMRERGDYDGEDRTRVKRETVERAMALLRELEGEA